MICRHILYYLKVANARFTAPLTGCGKTKFATVKWNNLCLQIIQSQTCYPLISFSISAPRTTLLSRPEILDLEPEALTLSWQRPHIDPSLPVSYRIDLQEPPSLDWRPITTGIPDTRYRVTGLRPSRDYHFRVTPVTSVGDLEPLPYVTLTSMPGER